MKSAAPSSRSRQSSACLKIDGRKSNRCYPNPPKSIDFDSHRFDTNHSKSWICVCNTSHRNSGSCTDTVKATKDTVKATYCQSNKADIGSIKADLAQQLVHIRRPCAAAPSVGLLTAYLRAQSIPYARARPFRTHGPVHSGSSARGGSLGLLAVYHFTSFSLAFRDDAGTACLCFTLPY